MTWRETVKIIDRSTVRFCGAFIEFQKTVKKNPNYIYIRNQVIIKWHREQSVSSKKIWTSIFTEWNILFTCNIDIWLLHILYIDKCNVFLLLGHFSVKILLCDIHSKFLKIISASMLFHQRTLNTSDFHTTNKVQHLIFADAVHFVLQKCEHKFSFM